MEGYQFARMETYSVQGAPRRGRQIMRTRKSGARAWTAEEVLREAERDPLHSLHVEPGGPPPEILPGAVGSFAEVRAAHSEAASRMESYMRKQRDGSFKKSRRKLRADARTLYSSVISLPARSADALADPVLREECMGLLRAAMEHERGLIEKSGGVLLMGVVHWDEDHVHAHYLGIHPEAGRVDRLHPGLVAKAAFNEAHANAGAADRKAVGKGANRAYREAMSAWQDQLYASVFDDAGLLRFGPRRHRLTRADYNQAKAAKAKQVCDAKKSGVLSSQIAAQEDLLAAVVEEAAETKRSLTRREVALAHDRIDLLVRESDAASLARKAGEELQRGRTAAQRADMTMRAMTRGMEAVDGRELDYRPATGDVEAGLVYGPKAPETKEARRDLVALVRPALDFVVSYARRVFGLRKREAAAEADRKAADAARERGEADLRRRAAVIEASLRNEGRKAPASLQAIARGREPVMEASSFPGAWAIREGCDIPQLQKRLNDTPNLALRVAWQETRDAKLITAEDAKDASLHAEFGLGLKILVAEAQMRGFDLETGRHDPSKATIPDHALIHRDQLPGPMTVIRRDQQRQRVRS